MSYRASRTLLRIYVLELVGALIKWLYEMNGATIKMHYGHFSVVLCLSFVKVAQLKLLAVLH